MDLIEGLSRIVDMEMIVEDMVVGIIIEDKIDIIVDMAVEGKNVGEVGIHNHILTNFVKVGFGVGFAEEVKLAMA